MAIDLLVLAKGNHPRLEAFLSDAHSAVRATAEFVQKNGSIAVNLPGGALLQILKGACHENRFDQAARTARARRVSRDEVARRLLKRAYRLRRFLHDECVRGPALRSGHIYCGGTGAQDYGFYCVTLDTTAIAADCVVVRRDSIHPDAPWVVDDRIDWKLFGQHACLFPFAGHLAAEKLKDVASDLSPDHMSCAISRREDYLEVLFFLAFESHHIHSIHISRRLLDWLESEAWPRHPGIRHDAKVTFSEIEDEATDLGLRVLPEPDCDDLEGSG